MVDPPPWPERPPGTQDFDLFWLVNHLPPEPWPETPDNGWDRATYGPPGTVYRFSLESLYARYTAPGTPQIVKAAIERYFRKLRVKLPPLGSSSWAVPDLAPPATPVTDWPHMRWIRTTIVGTLNTNEQIAHVFQWRNKTTENPAMTLAEIKTFGDLVRDKWAAFLSAEALTGSTGFPLRGFLTDKLTYTEVRSAYLEQLTPGKDEPPRRPGAPAGIAKPDWIIPTQVSAFTAPQGKGTAPGAALPYEVAMALTLNTNFRGPRFRGRVYLGGFGAQVMTADGDFTPNLASGIGHAFGLSFLDAVQAGSAQELHVISQKYATSARVQGVRVGVVPDSQRRRRRSRVENFTQQWGQPVGAL